jgi:hypothetical protein
LRLGGKRCGEEAARDGGNERPPVHHSITWSARCRSEGGIVKPRALAVVMSSHLPASPTILSARRTSSTPISEAHLL